MDNDIIIRDIENTDFHDYLTIMKEFHGYDYQISYDKFIEELNFFRVNNNCYILVIYSKNDNKIIGAGSIYKLIKLHNNPIGQIEDVIITEKYRGYGYGKLIINKLTDIGFSKMNCYKVILNCLEKNIPFYKKCNFVITGTQLKFNKI